MPFIRRYQINPGSVTLGNVASVNIIDAAPQSIIPGVQQATVGIVAEFVKGLYKTPIMEGSFTAIMNDFGNYSPFVGDGDLSANGNGIVYTSGFKFNNMVVVRVNLEMGQVTYTLSGVTTAPILIPAGSRVKCSGAPTHIYITDQDLTIPGTTGNLTGTVGITPLNAADFGGVDAIAAVNTVVDTPSGLGVVTISCSNTAATTELTQTLIVSAYQSALNTTLVSDGSAGSKPNIMYSARKDPLSAIPASPLGTPEPIREALILNAINFSNLGGTNARYACTCQYRGATKTNALNGIGSTQTVNGQSNEREFCEYIAVKWNSPQAGAMFEITSDVFMASILSQLPEWENPGQGTPYTAGVLGLESDFTVNYAVADYITFEANGINAFLMDQQLGPVFDQGFTGVNSSVYPNLRRISRRRMADFIEASCALGAAPFVKQLSTPAKRDALVGEVIDFLRGLYSPSNPENQHIGGFSVDDVSGNTPTTLALGQFVILVNVTTLPSMDSITFMMNIGEFVTISEQV